MNLTNCAAAFLLFFLLQFPGNGNCLKQQSSNIGEWANAALGLTADFKNLSDESRFATFGPGLPFSFVYDGKHSDTSLKEWKFESGPGRNRENREIKSFSYTDPKTSLKLTGELITFSGFPAVEWVFYFENTGNDTTPVIESILPLDLDITVKKLNRKMGQPGAVILHDSEGAREENHLDFIPNETEIFNGSRFQMAPEMGRSSHGRLPYFNLQWPGGGMIGAIGWSGQWEMTLSAGDNRLNVTAGQQTSHFKLYPGEKVRTPSIVLLRWSGEKPITGTNLFRRMMREYYILKRDEKPLLTPTTWKTWSIFATLKETNYTEKNQKEWIDITKETGVEMYKLDGAWWDCFGSSYWNRGNWRPDSIRFPNGIRPVTDYAHEADMKVSIFIEPEVASPGSIIAREHPEFILGKELVDFGNPEALNYMIELFSEKVEEWGADVYRHDFNSHPLPVWEAENKKNPDRAGITEAKHVAGLYRFWDEIQRRHPDLIFDSCTSGGCRLDIEVMKRCLVLWRTDLYDGNRSGEFQVHNQGLSLYLPVHSGGVWAADPYNFRSAATVGAVLSWDARETESETVAQINRGMDEIRELRPLYLGDYYPLFKISGDTNQWCGWQYNRPETGEGFAVVLRRPGSPYHSAEIRLNNLDKEANYSVEFRKTYKTNRTEKISGASLSALNLELEPKSSLLIKYKRID